jgi:GR25 family glycosyltransferase involved in LPS biosynthesis
MKGLVINLEERPDRLESFYKNNKLPFEVERFNAIKFKDGAVGCAYSHIEGMRKFSEFPFIIFEDDCVMLEDWSVVETAMKQLPSNWDALWLGATLTQPLKIYSKNLFELKRAYCLHAVIYNTPRIVDYICREYSSNPSPIIDVFYFNQVLEKFNCFITAPIVATQGQGMSNITGKFTTSWIIESSYHKYTGN